jgi:hypothetical protein
MGRAGFVPVDRVHEPGLAVLAHVEVCGGLRSVARSLVAEIHDFDLLARRQDHSADVRGVV